MNPHREDVTDDFEPKALRMLTVLRDDRDVRQAVFAAVYKGKVEDAKIAEVDILNAIRTVSEGRISQIRAMLPRHTWELIHKRIEKVKGTKGRKTCDEVLEALTHVAFCYETVVDAIARCLRVSTVV